MCHRGLSESLMIPQDLQQALTLAGEHHRAGRNHQAEAIYRQILNEHANQADALHGFGLLAYSEGKLDAAADLIRRAIAANPSIAAFHGNLGMVLALLERLDEAAAALRQALSLQPAQPEFHNNLANVLGQSGRLEQAIAHYRRALELRADYIDAQGNLAGALRAAGKADEALTAYRAAARLRPNDAEFHRAIGDLCRQKRDLPAAIAAYRQALALRPNDAQALDGLGAVLYRCGQPDEAREALTRAIALQPDLPQAHINLGNVLRELGEVDEAIKSYRRAVEICNDPAADSNLVYALYFHPAYDGPAILREHLRWARQHAEPLANQIKPHGNIPDPNRRLRIGYVSPDFREHVLSLHFVPLFANHDHQQFEVFFYSGVTQPDALTQRMRGYADVWRDAAHLSDEQLADLVRSDRIDILVDLTMHMANGRPLLFARKPAPIQIACDAYPGTTGLSTVDYRLTDPYIDPPGEHDDWYTEESIRLPDSFWVYDPLTSEPPVNPLPAFANGHVSFGALHIYAKLNDRMIRLYARVLNAVPGSRLLMLGPPGSVRQRVVATMAKEGITADRIEFAPRQPRAKYLELYHRIDIHLDTLPYNAHATALDSFWMGVPMVTLVGQTLVGRAGWCYLNNLKLTELAAQTEDQFVRIAKELASDLDRLAKLRATLRSTMESSPLMNGKKFADAVATIYREAWRKWCMNLQP